MSDSGHADGVEDVMLSVMLIRTMVMMVVMFIHLLIVVETPYVKQKTMIMWEAVNSYGSGVDDDGSENKMRWCWSRFVVGAVANVGVSENKGVPYIGVLLIRILLFRVLY